MRAALIPALAVGALVIAAPAALPEPGGHGHGGGAGDHVPPGQEKKAAATAQDPPAAVATEPSTAVDGAPAQPASTSRATSKNAYGGASSASKADAKGSRAGSKAATADAKAAAATTTKASMGSTDVPATPPAQPVTPPPPAAPTVVATAPPAPPASAVAARRPSSATRRAGAGAATRRAARARPTAGPRPAKVVPAAPQPTTADRPATRSASFSSRDDGAVAPAADQRSPLTRTVVRVLEVVPPGVRIALAALALLGLLLGVATAVQTVRSRRLARQRQRLLADVGVLQSALLTELPARIGGARVSAAYRPAAGFAAGGDFYDAFELPGGRTAVIVGDIAGHGRDAVPLTAHVRYNLRAYLQAGLAPRATLNVASNVLQSQLGGRQVTIVVAIFDPGTGRLTYACAGHWPPLLLGTTATLVTASSSPPIGVDAPTGRRQTTVALAPGASACFFTDGLTESLLGRRRRLGRDGVRAELDELGPDRDAADLIARVVRRTDAQPDDMAACILTALPGGAEHWSVQLEELEVDRAMLRAGSLERFLVACGAGRPQIGRALREADAIVSLAGSAIVEVRIGEQLLEVRVAPPPAVSLPIARRRTSAADGLAATG